MELLTVGIDGNCGFALLGENLQEGEADFVEVPAPGGYDEETAAMLAAVGLLRDRLKSSTPVVAH